MMEHSTRRATGPWRHRTFLLWIAATAIVSVYLAVAAPFAEYAHDNLRWVALVVPPVSFMLMAVGIGWLVWLATAKPKAEREHRRNQGSIDPAVPRSRAPEK